MRTVSTDFTATAEALKRDYASLLAPNPRQPSPAGERAAEAVEAAKLRATGHAPDPSQLSMDVRG